MPMSIPNHLSRKTKDFYVTIQLYKSQKMAFITITNMSLQKELEIMPMKLSALDNIVNMTKNLSSIGHYMKLLILLQQPALYALWNYSLRK